MVIVYIKFKVILVNNVHYILAYIQYFTLVLQMKMAVQVYAPGDIYQFVLLSLYQHSRRSSDKNYLDLIGKDVNQ